MSVGSSKKQESLRKTSISALLTMLKPLTMWITTNCGKFWTWWEYQIIWPAPWEICMQVKKQHLGLDMEQQFSSVQFSCSVESDSLRPHETQHARPPCPSSTPRVHPNTCPLIRWCLPTISSSVVPFSSCPQSFPASGSFSMSPTDSKSGKESSMSRLYIVTFLI